MRRAGATLCCGAWASHCGGFFCCGAWALGMRASVVVARGLRSCNAGFRAQAQLLWHMGLVAPQHVGSSQTRDQTHVPCIGRQILNHCTTREIPLLNFDRHSINPFNLQNHVLQFWDIFLYYFFINFSMSFLWSLFLEILFVRY